jgi:hypothetical protein
MAAVVFLSTDPQCNVQHRLAETAMNYGVIRNGLSDRCTEVVPICNTTDEQCMKLQKNIEHII